MTTSRMIVGFLGASLVVVLGLIGVTWIESGVTLRAGLPYVRAEALVTTIRESLRIAYGGEESAIACLEVGGADPTEDVARAVRSRVAVPTLPASRCVRERSVGRNPVSVVVDPLSENAAC